MFGNLLESRAQRVRQRGGTVVSVGAHCVLVALAVLTTGLNPIRVEASADERVVPLNAPVQDQPVVPRTEPAGPTQPSGPVTPAPLQRVVIPDLLTGPIVILDYIPDPGPAALWVTDSTRSRQTVTGVPGTGAVDGIPFASGVEKPAISLPGNPPPRYPDALRNAGIAGTVTIQVVVDTAGRADLATLKFTRSDHERLNASVSAALGKYRFLAAETGGRKVPMWVEMSFVFELRKD
jgi:protein TonB